MSRKMNFPKAWDKDRFREPLHAAQLPDVRAASGMPYSEACVEFMREEFARIGAKICTRCGAPFWRAKHTRLHGYMCQCGNQEWKSREDEEQTK